MTDSNTPEHAAPKTGPVLSAKWYERFKWISFILIPAASTLYFGLGSLWEWPEVDRVVGSAAIVELFLGTILGISNYNFKRGGADGSINAKIVGDTVELSKFNLPNIAPEELAHKNSVTIQVNPKN